MELAAPQDSAKRTLRVVWGACTLALATAAMFVLGRLDPANPPMPGLDVRLVQGGVLAALVVFAGVGLFARTQCYKRNWVQDAVTPAGYVRGNVLLFVVLEAFALLALAATYLTAHPPMMLPVLVIGVLFAVNFPAGKPMLPRRSP